jgi:FkbM family methyltransferase
MSNSLLSSIIETLYNSSDYFHEKRLKKFYSKKEIDIVIDVGSHKGEFINNVIDDITPIYSFEPQTSVRNSLIKSTSNKNVKEYFDTALSDFNGEIDLILNNLSSTSSIKKSNPNSLWMKIKKFLLGGEIIAGKEKIKVSKLDDVLLERLSSKDRILIKIDVEGAEAEVLKGAEKILKSCNVAYVQLESANYNIYTNIDNKSPIHILQNHGFRIEKKFLFPLLNFTDIVLSKS